MACDHALFEAAAAGRIGPALRCYSWPAPAVSIGYFASSEAARARCGSDIPIVRRWTGGGIVAHQSGEFTYCLVIPADGRSSHDGRTLYAAVHRALRDALIRAGVAAKGDLTLAPPISPGGPEFCFDSPAEGDLMAGNSKIAGAAQRRTRCGLMQQGTLQLGLDLIDFAALFAAALAESVVVLPPEMAITLERSAQDLAQSRYADSAWTESAFRPN